MKHNYVKILALDFNVALFKGRQVADIFINDCQIYNNNSTHEFHETHVSYFVL